MDTKGQADGEGRSSCISILPGTSNQLKHLRGSQQPCDHSCGGGGSSLLPVMNLISLKQDWSVHAWLPW